MTNPRHLFRKATNHKNCFKLSCCNYTYNKFSSSFVHAIIHPNPFWVQLGYFVILSLVGFVFLKTLEFKTSLSRPKDIDLLFTSVSAVTVSSMSTVDMEVFSNSQLIVLTLLMFFGGEIFMSMIGLQFQKFKKRKITNFDSNHGSNFSFRSFECGMELGVTSNDSKRLQSESIDQNNLLYEPIRSLGYIVLCYILVVHFFGFIMVYLYIAITPSSKSILINKGLSRQTFSLFTIVSTFANCGFVPTNENMIVFKKNSGLLLILIPQILLGSTLYPVVLRATILVLEKITKRTELGYILSYSKEMGYGQLLPRVQTFYLAMTVVGLILVKFVVFCSIEWHNIDSMGLLNGYEKVICSLFQVLNTRYAGESVFDLSKLSPAILVVFAVMMYIPQLTTYLPVQDHDNYQRKEEKKTFVEYLLFSRLSYLVIFTIFICLSERRKMDTDPLNFSVLNIAFEVFSAYGNVGLSIGYSCQKQIKIVEHCKEEWYGFAGRWSNNGKYLLILVMFFGRLKNFNKNGGRFWNVS